MAFNGALGSTAEELKKVLNFGEIQATNNSFAESLTTYNKE